MQNKTLVYGSEKQEIFPIRKPENRISQKVSACEANAARFEKSAENPLIRPQCQVHSRADPLSCFFPEAAGSAYSKSA